MKIALAISLAFISLRRIISASICRVACRIASREFSGTVVAPRTPRQIVLILLNRSLSFKVVLPMWHDTPCRNSHRRTTLRVVTFQNQFRLQASHRREQPHKIRSRITCILAVKGCSQMSASAIIYQHYQILFTMRLEKVLWQAASSIPGFPIPVQISEPDCPRQAPTQISKTQ